MPKIRTTALDGKDKLVADLQRVITDAEELMQATAHQTEGKVVELRDRINENLREARHKLADAEEAIKEKTLEMARAIGAAAGVGLLVGLLISRR
jgi:ElaB/YqjD/DUF883 family membrane-anchored ribosome-binding protein